MNVPPVLLEPSPEVERDNRTEHEAHVGALSVAEAALVLGRHESTLRRYLLAGQFPNAYRGAHEAWRIPVSDLMSEGLLTRAADAGPAIVVGELEAELERQQAENTELRARLAVAETLADERADRIRELRLSVRMLLGMEPPEGVAVTHGPDARPFVWSGEIALKDG